VTTTTPRRAVLAALPVPVPPGGVTTARPQASQHAHTVARSPGGAHDTRQAIDLAVTISIPPAGYQHAGRHVVSAARTADASGIPLSRPAVEAPSPRTRAPGGVQLAERQDASEAQSSCALGVQPAGGRRPGASRRPFAAGIYSRPAKVSALPMAVPRGGPDLTGGRRARVAQTTFAGGAFSRPTEDHATTVEPSSGGHLLAGRQRRLVTPSGNAASVLPADRHLGIACSQGTYAVGSYSRPAIELPVSKDKAPGGPHHAGRRLPADVQVRRAAGIYSRLPNQLAVTTAHPADGALHAGRRAQHGNPIGFAASVQPADRRRSYDAHQELAVGFDVTQASVATQPTGTKREPLRRSAS